MSPTVTVKGYDANSNYLGVTDNQDIVVAQQSPVLPKALDGVVYRYNGPWWENGAPTGGYQSPSTVTKDFLFVWYPRASGGTDSFWNQWADVNSGLSSVVYPQTIGYGQRITTADGCRCYIGSFDENTKEFTISSQYSPHRSPQYTQEICGAVCLPYGHPPIATVRGVEPFVEYVFPYPPPGGTPYHKYTDLEVVYTGENVADFILSLEQNVYYDYQQDPNAGGGAGFINNVDIGITMNVTGTPGVLPRGQNIPVSLHGGGLNNTSGTFSFLYAVQKDGNFDIVCSGVATGPASQTVGASRWVKPPASKYFDFYGIALDSQGNPYELDSLDDPIPAGAPQGSFIEELFILTDDSLGLDPPLFDTSKKIVVRYPISVSRPQTALDDIFDV